MSEQISSLIEQLRHHRSRSEARRALNKLEPAQITPQLLQLLQQKGAADNTVWAAISILKRIRCEEALPILQQILPERPNLQFDISQAIAELGGESELSSQVESEAGEADIQTQTYFTAIITSFTYDQLLDSEIHGDLAYLNLKTAKGRTQRIVLQAKDDILLVHTEAGLIPSEKGEKVLRLNDQLETGFIKLREEGEGQSMVVLRAEVASDRGIFEIKGVVERMAQVGDSLEEQISGKDEI